MGNPPPATTTGEFPARPKSIDLPAEPMIANIAQYSGYLAIYHYQNKLF
jgi:hypothetical protein